MGQNYPWASPDKIAALSWPQLIMYTTNGKGRGKSNTIRLPANEAIKLSKAIKEKRKG